MSPHSQYQPGREPPSFLDRILAHAFVVVLSIASVVTGVAALGAAAEASGEVSRALTYSPLVTQVLIALPLIAGGPIALAGALGLVPRLSTLRHMAVERIGNTLLAGGWAAYASALLASENPFATVPLLAACGIALALLVRCLALALSERRIKARIQAKKGV